MVDHVRVVNSTVSYSCVVGEQVANIDSMQFFDYAVQGDSRRFLVRLAMAAMEESEFNVFENRRFAVRQGGRKLIVVHQKINSPNLLDYTSIIVEDQVPKENQSDEDVEALDPSKIFGPDSYSDSAD